MEYVVFKDKRLSEGWNNLCSLQLNNIIPTIDPTIMFLLKGRQGLRYWRQPSMTLLRPI
jgi:hypothetical protein